MTHPDRNKYLTEAMGITYGNSAAGTCDGCVRLDICKGECPTVDFSTWPGFGKLKEYISTTDHHTEFWIYFFDMIDGAVESVDDLFDGIYPDSLADNYYHFLKGRES